MTVDLPLDAADRLLLAASLRNYEADLLQLASLTKPGITLSETTLDADLRRCRTLIRRVEGRTDEDVIDSIPADAAAGGTSDK